MGAAPPALPEENDARVGPLMFVIPAFVSFEQADDEDRLRRQRGGCAQIGELLPPSAPAAQHERSDDKRSRIEAAAHSLPADS